MASIKPTGTGDLLSSPVSVGRTGLVHRIWLSEPAIRLGCLPLDLFAELLMMLGAVARWVERERSDLDG